MSELNSHEEAIAARQNILRITPEGEDPVLYWHQVAVDAIKARERREDRVHKMAEDLRHLQNRVDMENQQKIADLKNQSLPQFRELLSGVTHGDFYMTVQLSFYPNGDVKESSPE